MMLIFTSLWTIFILLAGGYIAKKVKILKQKQAKTFLDFAIMFALPCLMFDKIYHLDLNVYILTLIIMGLTSCILGAFFAVMIGKIFKFSKATLASMFLLTCFGNIMFIGFPLASSLFKETQYMGEIVLYDMLTTNLPIALFGSFILSFGSKEKASLATNIKRILSFPPFLSIIFALFCKAFVLPEFIFSPLRLFGNSAAPVALFAIGLSLGFSGVKSSYKATLIVILSKMCLAPLFFIALIKLFGLEFNTSSVIAIIQSATPTMALAGAMVMKAKLDTNLATSSVAFGTLFAFVNMPILLHFLL